ncbi:MAG: 3-oxoacyl-[acyl-carrier-protein] reductase [Nitrospiraceae bacterium]|nr:3-oxoacyl-[acyl-carrier-protein] reductase [Nitrospiraceae bacterium]
MPVCIDLSGKVAIVTGGTRGIGKAVAEGFRDAGAVVYITGRKTETIKKISSEIGVKGMRMDVSNAEDVDKGIEDILKAEGKIDVLVNNAGITKDKLFVRMNRKDWDSVIDVNLNGIYNVTRAVVPSMVKARSGVILSISSVVAFTGVGQVNYSASKSAIIGMTKSLSRELAPRNIRVNAIAPGYIETDMTRNIPEKIRETIIKSIPLRREGKPEEVASLCLFLASDMASYITGTTIHVNGGLF